MGVCPLPPGTWQPGTSRAARATLNGVSSPSTRVDLFGDPPWDSSTGEKKRTYRRGPQIVALLICTLASSAFVATIPLPWFGFIDPSNPSPQYNAVSQDLAPPLSSPGLAPGTQGWGYLLVVCSVLVAGLAVVAIIACVRRRNRSAGTNRLLLCVAIASLDLIALVVLEMTATLHFGDGPRLGFDWGAIVGLALAVLSSVGAWFAWASNAYPWLSGYS